MTGKHKTSLLGWHPRSAELEAWIRAEAEKRGSLADVLEDGMSAAMEASKPKSSETRCPHGYPDVRQVAGVRVCRKCG